MTFLKRVSDCIASHAHAFVSKFEDPILRTERAIAILKDMKQKSFDSLAQVKALTITTSEDIKTKKIKIKEFEDKAYELLKKAKQGELQQEQADSLASTAIQTKLKLEKELTFLLSSLDKYKQLEENLELKTQKIAQQITDCEFELTSLKSRMNVASTLKEISKSTNCLSDESVTSLLQDTESKVRNEEALATAYDSIKKLSPEEQIDAAIGTTQDRQVKEELEKLKSELV